MLWPGKASQQVLHKIAFLCKFLHIETVKAVKLFSRECRKPLKSNNKTVMSPAPLTGSRIRQRRLVTGLKQAELAQQAGISPAYLNLIEHNRRRIGGLLLTRIAGILDIDPARLTEGAAAEVLADLRAAAAADPAAEAEIDRTEEFAARYAGWAAVLAGQHRRLAGLEARIEALEDRLTHDPELGAALHEVISAATSIRSTASILVSGEELDADWQRRFHGNIHGDSLRLADASQALVDYLEGEGAGAGPAGNDADASTQMPGGTPQDEVERFLDTSAHHMPLLEDGAPVSAVLDAARAAGQLTGRRAVALAEVWLTRYARDAAAIPLADLEAAIGGARADPAALAAAFGADLPTVLRRLASVPTGVTGLAAALVVADGSGTVLHRKRLGGFPMPRTGAPCALWPLFDTLARPGLGIHECLELPGPVVQRYDAYAVSAPVGGAVFGQAPRIEATMLVAADAPDDGRPARAIGPACGVCPRDACPARREPSALRGVF